MRDSVRHLARKHAQVSTSGHTVGGSVALPTPDLKKLQVQGPEGASTIFEGDRITGRSSVRFTRTDHAGVYRVLGTDPSGVTHPRDDLSFVVNVDPRGSDLTPAPPAALPASGRGTGAPPADDERRVELWHGLAAALLLLLLAEGLLVQR